MDKLVRATLLARRIVRAGDGIAATCLLAAFVVVSGASGRVGVAARVAAGLWVVVLGKGLQRQLASAGEAPLILDFERGALLSVGLDALLRRLDGNLSGRFSPATYLLVALEASVGRP